MKDHEKLIKQLSKMVAFYIIEARAAETASMAAYYRGRVSQAEYTLEFMKLEFNWTLIPKGNHDAKKSCL